MRSKLIRFRQRVGDWLATLVILLVMAVGGLSLFLAAFGIPIAIVVLLLVMARFIWVNM